MRNSNQVTGFGPMFSAVTAMVSPVHQNITRQPLYDQVEPLKIHPGIKAVFMLIATWRRRARERRDLARLDDHLLRDIGIERSDVAAERAKPFWRA